MTAEQYDQIRAYLKDELSEEQSLHFIKMLEEDVDLMRAFEIELMLHISIDKEVVLEAFAAETAPGFESVDTHIEMINKSSKSKVYLRPVPLYEKYRKIIGIAAVLIVAFSIYIFSNNTLWQGKNYVQNKVKEPANRGNKTNVGKQPIGNKTGITQTKPKTTEVLYTAYYKRYKQRNEAGGNEIGFLSYYDEKKYAYVLEANTSDYILRSEGSFNTADSLSVLYIKFYQALSYVETNRPAMAIGLFKLVNASEIATNSLKDDINWYLSLAYLKLQNSKAAKELLTRITGNKNALHYLEASQLLSELE